MNKTITFLALVSLFFLTASLKHQGTNLELTQMDPLLFDHSGHFRTWFV